MKTTIAILFLGLGTLRGYCQQQDNNMPDTNYNGNPMVTPAYPRGYGMPRHTICPGEIKGGTVLIS